MVVSFLLGWWFLVVKTSTFLDRRSPNPKLAVPVTQKHGLKIPMLSINIPLSKVSQSRDKESSKFDLIHLFLPIRNSFAVEKKPVHWFIFMMQQQQVAGITEAVAKEFFDSRVTTVVLNPSEEVERTGKKEHVVFLVKQTDRAHKTTDQDQFTDRGIQQCKTAEDLTALQQDLCDWIAECGIPGVFKATVEDVPKIYAYVVKHYIFLSYNYSTRGSNHREAEEDTIFSWEMVLLNMIEGITEAVAKEFFDSRVTTVVLNPSEEVERTGKKEHVVFLVKQTDRAHKTTDQDQFTDRGEKNPLSKAAFKAIFSYNYSTRGSNHREAEEDTIFSWEMVLLNMIEDKVTELRFEDLLIFVTGADEVPALGFPRKPRIDFYEQEAGRRRLPHASTCAMCLHLPRGITEEDKLHEMLFQATRDSLGFGKV
ncbi:Guanylate cyclase soluble subunit beta-2 [Nibea albiflora]|nr:Guanylate cyclase soluble subunit beta-2 [Nibea albiflora]